MPSFPKEDHFRLTLWENEKNRMLRDLAYFVICYSQTMPRNLLHAWICQFLQDKTWRNGLDDNQVIKSDFENVKIPKQSHFIKHRLFQIASYMSVEDTIIKQSTKLDTCHGRWMWRIATSSCESLIPNIPTTRDISKHTECTMWSSDRWKSL